MDNNQKNFKGHYSEPISQRLKLNIMKEIMILLVGILIISCNQTKQEETKSDLDEQRVEQNKGPENFDWLLGQWKRLKEEEGVETYETWKKSSPNNLAGHGFILKNADTVWQEKMVLSKKDSIWTLDIETPGNNDLVQFRLVKNSSNSFTVENPMHDFPKEIKYWRDNDQLRALLMGDSMKLEYEFEEIR